MLCALKSRGVHVYLEPGPQHLGHPGSLLLAPRSEPPDPTTPHLQVRIAKAMERNLLDFGARHETWNLPQMFDEAWPHFQSVGIDVDLGVTSSQGMVQHNYRTYHAQDHQEQCDGE